MTYRACINFRRDAFRPPYGHAVYFWSIATWSDLPRPARDELFGTSVNVPLRGRRLRRSVSFAHSTTKREARKGNENAGETHVGEHFSTMTRTNSSAAPMTAGRAEPGNRPTTTRQSRSTGTRTRTQWWCACSSQTARPASYALRYRARRSTIDDRRSRERATTDDAARRDAADADGNGAASGLLSRRRRRGSATRRSETFREERGELGKNGETHSRGRSTLAATEITRSRSAVVAPHTPSAPAPETDIVSAHDTHVLTVRQGWPQHRYSVVIRCCCPGGCHGSLGQKRGSLIASPSPCHTCSSNARCRGVSPSSSRCRPSRSYLHAPMSDIGPDDTTRTRMFHRRALLPSNDWNRYGRLGKIHFPMAQHPRLRPHFAAMLQNRRSAVPSCHAASSYDSAIATANRSARRMRVEARPRPNCRQRRASAQFELDYRSSFLVPRHTFFLRRTCNRFQ